MRSGKNQSKWFILEIPILSKMVRKNNPECKMEGLAKGFTKNRKATNLFRRTWDGEGMPLEGRDGRDVDEDVVAGLEREVRRTPDDQRNDFRRKNDAGRHPTFALLKFSLSFSLDNSFVENSNAMRYKISQAMPNLRH